MWHYLPPGSSDAPPVTWACGATPITAPADMATDDPMSVTCSGCLRAAVKSLSQRNIELLSRATKAEQSVLRVGLVQKITRKLRRERDEWAARARRAEQAAAIAGGAAVRLAGEGAGQS